MGSSHFSLDKEVCCMDAIRWQGDSLALLDQTRLPVEEVWNDYTDYRAVAEAIRRLVVRGAPAIGVAAVSGIPTIVGAMLGLALPTDVVQTARRGYSGHRVLLLVSKNSVRPVVTKQDAVGLALGMNGVFLEPSTGEVVEWKTHRTFLGLLFFIAIGIMAGMFGLGAGWANVPVLNLLMGVPLKVSVGTSKFLLSITDTSAAWVYLNQGCVIPLMAIPSIVGLMLGSVVGVRLLAKAKPKFIRYMVIIVLFFSGAKALMKGLAGSRAERTGDDL